jgi:anti-sigma regulatory factor (Ser/Thr protein kinase)
VNSNPHVVLPPELSSPRRAREFAINGIGTDDDGLCDTVALLVSEVASNAVLHARTPFQVTLHADEQRIRIEVTDSSSAQPVVKQYRADSVTGRGLHLVEAAASRWGIEPTASGKTVWFEVDRAEDEAAGEGTQP